jgi:peptidyl-prolyl cis-trans isomerase D
MLQLIRGTVGSWIVKGLFIILIVSFAIWGIGDIFRGHGPSNTVAEVGPVHISMGEVDQEFRKQVNRLRQMFGGRFDPDQARQLGLVEQSLGQLIERALFDLVARDAGLEAGDELVRRRIQQIPGFQNVQGQFEPELLRRALAANSLTEPGFIQMVREETGRELVVGALSAGVVVPKALAETLYRLREETRVVETVSLANAAMPDPGTPDEAEQTRFHEDRAVQFTAPEYRKLTVLALTVEEFGKTLEITEEDVRLSYEQRADEFQTPEHRTFRQVLVDTQDKAQKIADGARAQADDLDAAAKAEGAGTDILENVAEADLPELGSAVFAIDPNTVSEPLKSALGWHVIKVTKVTPGSTRKLEEVRERVARELRQDRAADGISRFANKIDDALAGGASLEEAAKTFGLTLTAVEAVDSTGLKPGGEKLEAVPELAQVLQTAFNLAEGSRSPMTELADNASFTVRVDGITPSRLRPLAEVRDQVIAGWKAERRAQTAEARAEELLNQLKAGASLEALAQAAGVPVEVSESLTRDGRKAGKVPQTLVAEIFRVAPGGAARAATGEGQVVARLKEIHAAEPAAGGEVLTKLTEELRRGMAADLVGQFTNALRVRYPVYVNESRVKQLSAAN